VTKTLRWHEGEHPDMQKFAPATPQDMKRYNMCIFQRVLKS